MDDFSVCPACQGSIKLIDNDFCKIRSGLIYNKLEFKQYICNECYHSCTYHNVPLELIYNSDNALPTDRDLGDYRLEFIKRHMDINSIDGMSIEIGGGPGELAEQLRDACAHEKGLVVDFVDRVSFDNLDFVFADLNHCEPQLVNAINDIGIANKKNVFLLSHLLEHIFNPVEILTALKKFRNSYFFIEVPDFGVSHDASVLRYSVNCPDHIHYFNSRSLLELIQKCGLNVIAFERQKSPLVPALRILCDCSTVENSVYDYGSHLQNVSQQFIDLISTECTQGNVYVWGLTPFSAKAITDMDSPERKIKYIFDTKFEHDDFLGIPVLKDPAVVDGQFGVKDKFICGSTFSVVQRAMKSKLEQLSADARFLTLQYE